MLFREFGNDSLHRLFDGLLRSRPDNIIGDERGVFESRLPDFFFDQQIDRSQVFPHHVRKLFAYAGFGEFADKLLYTDAGYGPVYAYDFEDDDD